MTTGDGGVDLERGRAGARAGDGGAATAAQVIAQSLAVDTQGNLCVGEPSRVRKVGIDGIIRTVAGGCFGVYGDLGRATSACLT